MDLRAGEIDDGLVSYSGQIVRLRNLMRALPISTSRGLQVPILEGTLQSREAMKSFLREYEEYPVTMAEGMIDGIPKRPVGILELMDLAQKQLLKGIHNVVQIVNKGQCIRAPRLVAGLIETRKDPKELESGIRDILGINVRKPVVDSVYQR